MISETLIGALTATADRVGDERGLRFYTTPDESSYIGYAELDRRARGMAAALQAAGYGPGDTALVALLPGMQWPIAVFGALYAGIAIVPAPIAGYGTSEALLSRVAALGVAGESSLTIADDGALDKLGRPEAGALPPIVTYDEMMSGDPAAWREPDVDAETTTFLMFTSGSTGDPKGVIATHGVLLGTAAACAELFGFGPDSVMVGWSPLHHAMGLLLQAITPAVNGAQSVITSPEQFQKRPIFWLQLISRHRGTVSVAGNFAFGVCTRLATDAQIAELDLSSLEVLMCGSEPVRPETMQAFLERFGSTGLKKTAIAPAFGMTEAMLVSAKPLGVPLASRRVDAASIESGSLVDSADGVELVSCGTWASDTDVVIVDPDRLVRVADGEIGEMWIASPTVSPGYFRRPDATAETFGHHLPDSDREYMRTGDLAATLDGELYITGRLKEVIIVRGRNIYPQDLEAAAQAAHGAVRAGAAFEVDGHPAPVAIVVEYDPEAIPAGDSLDSIVDTVRTELMTRASLPAVAVALVPEGIIPRTPTGKVRRRPTREKLEGGALTVHRTHGFRDDLTLVR